MIIVIVSMMGAGVGLMADVLLDGEELQALTVTRVCEGFIIGALTATMWLLGHRGV